MAHPQSTPRGLFSKKRVQVPAGGSVWMDDYSTSTGAIRANSTGIKVAGLTVNNSKIAGNSTGIAVSGIKLDNTSRVITSNSTGIKLGSRYISTNTTGNLNT